MQPRRKVRQYPMEQEALLKHMRRMRAAYEKTQGQVAKGMNLSRSQYTALEGGRSMLTFEHLVSVAKVYEQSVSTFLSVGGL
jgi:transcriptional regulator with XRE-family HTH domain